MTFLRVPKFTREELVRPSSAACIRSIQNRLCSCFRSAAFRGISFRGFRASFGDFDADFGPLLRSTPEYHGLSRRALLSVLAKRTAIRLATGEWASLRGMRTTVATPRPLRTSPGASRSLPGAFRGLPLRPHAPRCHFYVKY